MAVRDLKGSQVAVSVQPVTVAEILELKVSRAVEVVGSGKVGRDVSIRQ